MVTDAGACVAANVLVKLAPVPLTPASERAPVPIEPVVRLLEETPRDKLLEAVAERIRGGLSYREVLTAL